MDADRAHRDGDDVAEDETAGDGQHPGGHDPSGDTPAHRGQTAGEPTPRIAPEMACVVEIGMPKRVAISITVPAVVSAAKPCTGVSLVMRTPIVLMIRQPPVAVPMPIATAQMTFTQSGM